MKPVTAPLAIASAILVLLIVLAILLVPMLEAELRRTTAQRVRPVISASKPEDPIA